jgi:DNA-binding beta-propeller fold protein YncE
MSFLFRTEIIPFFLTLLLGWYFPTPGRAAEGLPFPTRLSVPAFPAGADWINTPQPLSWKQLRGKFVLLDFWTLGCINCMHVTAELKKLERAWPKELVVIGVHSAKFAREKDTRSITQAVERYGVTHPVVNDADFVLWKSLGIRAWPSLVLVDPAGFAVWGHSGEITFRQLNEVLRRAAPYYRRQGLINLKPLGLVPADRTLPDNVLRFPGKVLADEKTGRLFIADGGHHRVIIAGLDGTLQEVIGGDTPGRANGDFSAAQFHTPQGMALTGEVLYVADIGNHLIRKVDLRAKKVYTVAGTGVQNRGAPPFGRWSSPLQTALSSPWALAIHRDDLYIAMAGLHQIWRMRLDGSGIEVYAGNGVEDIVDGSILPRRPFQPGSAAFAQPSGLASDGTWLYVADAEGSSVREVPFDPGQNVRTVVGTADLPEARLFTFGDVDGPRPTARLQHPLGIVFYEGKLYVADTYNNKIKVVDPASGAAQTLAGSGRRGAGDNPAEFNEPAGLSAAAGKLYVADTNNHAIRVIDLRRGNAVSTLRIAGAAKSKRRLAASEL